MVDIIDLELYLLRDLVGAVPVFSKILNGLKVQNDKESTRNI